ncbi:hypothetical protein [Mangrovivirga cuniculi]|uniref:Uncharacterized protein n=1 Tax=Mangrovivirga cuniculi TaxID=2715131 RepID=A0A4D7JEE4_9BACT|nr:hypothetical protein [Mangrovivirga cuniculi]QCK14609.1 hypothetical protein DCC35_07555 [Mangrovivirga cuniculi]
MFDYVRGIRISSEEKAAYFQMPELYEEHPSSHIGFALNYSGDGIEVLLKMKKGQHDIDQIEFRLGDKDGKELTTFIFKGNSPEELILISKKGKARSLKVSKENDDLYRALLPWKKIGIMPEGEKNTIGVTIKKIDPRGNLYRYGINGVILNDGEKTPVMTLKLASGKN